MWIFRYLHKLLQYSYIPQSDTTTEWHRQPGMLMFVYLLYYCYHHHQSNLYLSALHYVYAPTSHFDWQTDFCMSEITGVKMMPPSSSVCRLPAMFSYNPMGSLGIAWTVCNPRWLISTPLQWHHKHTLKIHSVITAPRLLCGLPLAYRLHLGGPNFHTHWPSHPVNCQPLTIAVILTCRHFILGINQTNLKWAFCCPRNTKATVVGIVWKT